MASSSSASNSRSRRVVQLDYPPSSNSASASPSAGSFSTLRFDVQVSPNLAMPTTARGQPIELVFHNDWHIDPTVTASVHFRGDGFVSTCLSAQASGLVPLPPNYVCEAGIVKLYPPGNASSSDSSDKELGAEEDSASGSDIESSTDGNYRGGHPQARPCLRRPFHSLAMVLIWLTVAILCDSLLHGHSRHHQPLYQHTPPPTPSAPRPTVLEALPLVTDLARTAFARCLSVLSLQK